MTKQQKLNCNISHKQLAAGPHKTCFASDTYDVAFAHPEALKSRLKAYDACLQQSQERSRLKQ